MNLARLLLGSLLLLAVETGHAGAATNLVAKLQPVAPFPAVIDAAKSVGISLDGIAPPSSDKTLAPGDFAAGLVTLNEKKKPRTQWLIYFLVTTNSPAAKKPKPLVLYTCTGHQYSFSSSPAVMQVRTLGPFKENAAARRRNSFDDESATVDVNQDFLGIGLDQGAAAAFRWNAVSHLHGGTNFLDLFNCRPKPFSNARTNRDSQLDAQWQVTTNEERAVAGWHPACGSYFDSVQDTPGLDGILWKVVDLPSLWSFVKNRGVTVGMWLNNKVIDRYTPAGWNLPTDSPAYSMPLMIFVNQHKTLRVTFIVTSPQPPLLTCGGIIGFLAENPADEQNYLTLRIISAHAH